jgi:hypothetical protein
MTPWLQGTLAAIDTLAKKDACIIGRMCMGRSPEVAYLWLGATILGLQERLLQDVRRGQIAFDLESAVWSRTLEGAPRHHYRYTAYVVPRIGPSI